MRKSPPMNNLKIIFGLVLISGFLGACATLPLLSGVNDPAVAMKECDGLADKKDYEESTKCYELLKGRFAGSPEAIEADIKIADNLYRQDDFLVAAESYAGFIKIHPTHSRLDYVYYRAGLCFLKGSPKAIDRDQQYLDNAVAYLEGNMVRFPANEYYNVSKEKWVEARTRLGRHDLYVGRFYYKTGEYLAALPRFQTVIERYADIGLDEAAYYFMGRTQLKLSRKEKALEALEALYKRYPASPYRKKLAAKLGLS